jgi:glycosyl transferase, family 25
MASSSSDGVMNLLDHFPRILIISLPTRQDRRRRVVAELARIGSGLVPGKLDFFDGIRPTEAAGFPSIGARGCFLSHMGVLRQAADEGVSEVLVLEDDIVFNPDFARAAPDAFAKLRTLKWDIAYPGHFGTITPAHTDLGGWVPYTDDLICAHCYVVRGPAIRRLADGLKTIASRPAGHPDGGPMLPDGALNTLRRQNPDIVTLLAKPSLATQGGSPSDISDHRWFDRIPGVRQAIQTFRDARLKAQRR